MGLLAAVSGMMLILLFHKPSSVETTKPLDMSPEQLATNDVKPVRTFAEETVEDEVKFDENFLGAVEALSEDPIYGALAREIADDLQATGRTSAKKQQKLVDAISLRTVELDKALEQAMNGNNISLLKTLSESNFFSLIGRKSLSHWVWITTPAFEEYGALISTLAQAEEMADKQRMLKTLESIKAVTGYSGFDGQMQELKNMIAEDRQATLEQQLFGFMTSEDYESVIDLAGDNELIISGNQELQDLVKQARLALSKATRDERLSNALREARADDWESVVTTLRQIPDELRTGEINQLAESGRQILSLKQTLIKLAEKPDRLADESVESFAQKQIMAAQDFTPLSTSLDQLASQVIGLIEQASETVRVEIESDNKAKILIPRLGYIEPTAQKTLTLKKAKYKFIVRCEGAEDAFRYLDLRTASLNPVVKIRLICEG